jgi:hypothetical protein
MAKAYAKDGLFGSPGDFDVDEDGEYCGVIGGEMADRDTVGPVWDWRPDMTNASPAQTCKVLGTLDCNEFHTAREGTRGK